MTTSSAMSIVSTDAEHFVTLFDRAFLPQGLALHGSLLRHLPAAVLWVLCLDDETFDRLEGRHDTLRPIRLADVETDLLKRLRSERSRAEYCWTLTPITPRIVFDRDPTVQRVTYVDADLYFLRDPSPMLEEFEASGKAVLITDHAYAPEYDQSALSGRFCVQFMSFARDRGEPVRAWWQARCEEWCFDRMEEGRFGDQKYLDDWPTRFGADVHVLQARSSLLAPWNATRFPYGEAIAWHFHSLRLLPGRKVLLYRGYEVPRVVRSAIYVPYVAELRRHLDELGVEVVQFDDGPVRSAGRLVVQELIDLLASIRMRLGNMGRVERL